MINPKPVPICRSCGVLATHDRLYLRKRNAEPVRFCGFCLTYYSKPIVRMSSEFWMPPLKATRKQMDSLLALVRCDGFIERAAQDQRLTASVLWGNIDKLEFNFRANLIEERHPQGYDIPVTMTPEALWLAEQFAAAGDRPMWILESSVAPVAQVV